MFLGNNAVDSTDDNKLYNKKRKFWKCHGFSYDDEKLSKTLF